MSARLRIVRHGNTFDAGDAVTRVGGRTDLPLSMSGRSQVAQLGRRLAEDGVVFTSASCGPLRRTRETADAILFAQPGGGCELRVRLFLREIDYGPDENRPEDEVLARIGRPALDAWERAGLPPPGWRVDPDALVGNWQQLFADLADSPGEHLVVTSNGIARFALLAAGASYGEDHPPLKLATAAWGVITLGADGARVEAWNLRT